MSDLRELYQQVILDHYKNPRNYKIPVASNRTAEGYNPLCGDHYTLYLTVEDGVIKDIGFQGTGCAISKASASIMSTLVKGKSQEDADRLFQDFRSVVTGEIKNAEKIEQMGRLAAFAGVSEHPSRVKCAMLAWHTLNNALAGDREVVSTE
jgi:SUF system FeS assembly protein, NifU family